MTVFGTLVICALALSAWLAYMRFRDVLYPPVLQASLWAIVLLAYYLSLPRFDAISNETVFIFMNGVFLFAAGCYAATWDMQTGRDLVRVDPLPPNWLLAGIFWVTVSGLPVCIRQAAELASHSPTQSFLINLRYMETVEDLGTSFLWNYLGALATLSAGLHLLSVDAQRKPSGRLRFVVSVVVALAYAVLNTGRTWLLTLIFLLAAVAVLTRRLTVKKAALYTATTALAAFALVAVTLNKGANLTSPVAENVRGLWQAFQVYLLGGMPAFDKFIHSHPALGYGDNVFRSVWAVTTRLGFNPAPAPLVKEFVNTPFPANVYTVYRPYFEDFGLVGAVSIPFLLGIVHGVVYRKARAGNLMFICFYGLLLYALMMQFFQDQYFSLLSQWVQMGVVLWCVTSGGRSETSNLQRVPIRP